MKQEAINKIHTMGKVANVILNITKVFLIIGIIGVLIGSIVFAIMPKEFLSISMSGQAVVQVDLSALGVSLSEDDRAEINNEMSNYIEAEIEMNDVGYMVEEISAEDNSIFLEANAGTYTIYMKNFWGLLAAALVYLIASFVTVIFAGKMCKAFKDCQSPFEETVITHMQNFGYSLIPWAVIQSVTQSMMESVLNGSLTLSININLTMVLIVLLILCLIQVFKYGAVLQQESDETL